MGAVAGPPPPDEAAWSAERIEATLPAPLRAQFQREHLSFLALWQAKAQAEVPRIHGGEVAPNQLATRHKWGDLMDDWEL